jgi:hypothetical protein
MANVAIKAYSENISGFKIYREEVPILKVEESFWTVKYCLNIPTSPQGTDRIEITCFFGAEQAYFLSHDRQIVSLSSTASPPFPVGCILWIKKEDMLCQIDLPKYPNLRLCKKGNTVTASFAIQDRFGSGLILWGDHKIRKSSATKQIHVRANRIKSLQEAVWLEPYPSGARSVICLTDHPDYDTVPKIRLLHELFEKTNFRITKGVFPCSDYKLGAVEPGLDVPEYKKLIDLIHEGGSEIAYHGLSPLAGPPSIVESLRRIGMMNQYSPRTWIDHGCGSYLFSRDGVFKEGARLVDTLGKAGVENYWSYTDVWENPARHLDVWTQRRLLSAFSNFASFLWDKKPVSIPLMLYYGSSILKNSLGSSHIRPILHKPSKMDAWALVAAHSRRLKYYHENHLIFYDLDGQFAPMSNKAIWVFDTVLLNHLAFQLRPASIDILCAQNGLLLAHCYFAHQKGGYGTINCFIDKGEHVQLIPEFIENVEYISAMQSKRELITLSFDALRNALTNFVNASLIRTSNGWEIEANKTVVASQQSACLLGFNKQWCKGNVHYMEVEGRAVLNYGTRAYKTRG